MSQLVTEVWPDLSHGRDQVAAQAAGRHGAVSPSDAAESSAWVCPGWKRVMDVVGAAVGLVILSPMLLLIAAFVKCVSRGPVLFRQQRYGLDGRPFMLWKFRTMSATQQSTEHEAYVLDLMNDNSAYRKRDHELALIPGGRLIRQLGLDELPQLINVLMGEMSLVGPRPDVLPLDKYEAWQRARFRALPGITGLWQISGKNDTTFTTMICLDIAYIHSLSPGLDLLILARTIPAILFG